MSDFEKSLSIGKVGESIIAEWLKSRGNHILPVYEIEKGQYAGPAVYSSDGRGIIAPDILCFSNNSACWIEAKSKSSFTFHRKTKKWLTGIDIHNYEEYQEIDKLSEWPVYLMFLQKHGQAKDSPEGGPTGLYSGDLKTLVKNEHHRWGKIGKGGMVYWEESVLTKLDDYPFHINITKEQ